jgi:hypothetical protein
LKKSSHDLCNAVDSLRQFADRREIGLTIKQEIRSIIENIQTILNRVTEIEGLYDLDFSDQVDDLIRDAAEKWDSAEPGKIKDLVLEDIRKASPMLSELYVRGLDFSSAIKFNNSEVNLSSWIGNNIDEFSDLLYDFRREKRSEKFPNEWSILTRNRRNLGTLLNELKKLGVIKGKNMLVQSKAGQWVPFRNEWFRDDPDQKILIAYEKTDNRLFNLLKGEWMSCYVQNIMADQLKRHRIPFELYTMVTYHAPADLIRGGSDFDVVGRFRDKIVCVECKSGRLEESYGHFDHIKQRTDDLRRVISSMGAGSLEFLFYVVYDAKLNDENKVRAQFSDQSVMPLKLNEVRAKMSQTLKDAIS